MIWMTSYWMNLRIIIAMKPFKKEIRAIYVQNYLAERSGYMHRRPVIGGIENLNEFGNVDKIGENFGLK